MVDLRKLCAVSALAALAVAASAGAEPLPKEDCDKLKTELATLEQGGVKDLHGKGAVWGRANLGRDKLREVERYIAVEEQLSFRCGLAKARLTLPFSEEDAPPADPDASKEAKGEPVEPAAKPKPKPKPKPKAAAAPAVEAEAAKPAEAARPKPKPQAAPATESKDATAVPPKPAPKPKPKVDDAYRPPSSPNAGDPFAKQLQPKSQ